MHWKFQISASFKFKNGAAWISCVEVPDEPGGMMKAAERVRVHWLGICKISKRFNQDWWWE